MNQVLFIYKKYMALYFEIRPVLSVDQSIVYACGNATSYNERLEEFKRAHKSDILDESQTFITGSEHCTVFKTNPHLITRTQYYVV